ncbi:MAG: NAD-dependent malic enzyme, partial [Deltaproteobacteria bacterium]|nr:NAD-dependent malic enzyme [Deltaproteobacteria bacterium]
MDSRGLVTRARPNLEHFKATYARPTKEVAEWKVADPARISLEETVENVAPTVLIGTSATPGTFTESVVKAMARQVPRPIIFPLSNPTSKAECTPEDAINWTEGTAILATGSPFDPVHYGGKRYRIGQGNNAFIFPGIGLGICVARARRVTDGMFLDAANALAQMV